MKFRLHASVRRRNLFIREYSVATHPTDFPARQFDLRPVAALVQPFAPLHPCSTASRNAAGRPCRRPFAAVPRPRPLPLADVPFSRAPIVPSPSPLPPARPPQVARQRRKPAVLHVSSSANASRRGIRRHSTLRGPRILPPVPSAATTVGVNCWAAGRNRRRPRRRRGHEPRPSRPASLDRPAPYAGRGDKTG